MNTPLWLEYLSRFDYSSEHFQNIPERSTKYCVIIEPREHELLIPVIKNFMFLLQNKGWGLIVLHGTDNEQFVKENLGEWKTVNYVNMGIKNFNSMNEYNAFMTSSKLWKQLINDYDCQHALLFQTDCLLLKDNADDFLKYDYVGAPWYIEWVKGVGVGNGGLSLRNVEEMLNISEHFKARPGMNEDIYYSMNLTKLKGKIASFEEAKRFSVETVYFDDPMGLHKPHLNKLPKGALKHLLAAEKHK